MANCYRCTGRCTRARPWRRRGAGRGEALRSSRTIHHDASPWRTSRQVRPDTRRASAHAVRGPLLQGVRVGRGPPAVMLEPLVGLGDRLVPAHALLAVVLSPRGRGTAPGCRASRRGLRGRRGSSAGRGTPTGRAGLRRAGSRSRTRSARCRPPRPPGRGSPRGTARRSSGRGSSRVGRISSLPHVARRPMRNAWSSLRSRYGSHTVPCSERSSCIFGKRANQPCRIAAPTVSIAGRSP